MKLKPSVHCSINKRDVEREPWKTSALKTQNGRRELGNSRRMGSQPPPQREAPIAKTPRLLKRICVSHLIPATTPAAFGK